MSERRVPSRVPVPRGMAERAKERDKKKKEKKQN